MWAPVEESLSAASAVTATCTDVTSTPQFVPRASALLTSILAFKGKVRRQVLRLQALEAEHALREIL